MVILRLDKFLQLINVGFFVCFDSFLSLLTIMPARILMTFWRLLKTRFVHLSAIVCSSLNANEKLIGIAVFFTILFLTQIVFWKLMS